MNKYELTFVLPGGATPAKRKSVSEKIEKLVKAGKGVIKKTDDWGKIDLSYKINKELTGVFMHLNIEMEGSAAKDLGDKLRLNNDIIRYLLIKTDN
jgi:small subunit ribosomal protein S6